MVLGLLVFGFLAFVALLWLIGSEQGGGSANDGGAHAGGHGLNGYAALAAYLERRGATVRLSRSESALDDEDLLVLTPPQGQDGAELAEIVSARRYRGPTLVILSKWSAAPLGQETPGSRRGWVEIGSPRPPQWQGFLDDVTVTLAPSPRWQARGASGRFPAPDAVVAGEGGNLVPLVTDATGQRIFAAYVLDGDYPALDDVALAYAVSTSPAPGGRSGQYPLVVVFEPDLLDNFGLAQASQARLAEQLFVAMRANAGDAVIFDLTLNGHARSANLLTLAFTPPYLAATLCLLLAAVALAWRAFLRFGPPAVNERALAFGKAELVANAAGLIRRTGRSHLVGAPYADAVRERLARALALPRTADAEQTEAAIDRALAQRQAGAEPFSTVAARLRAARRPHAMVRAARDLHALERTLTR